MKKCLLYPCAYGTIAVSPERKISAVVKSNGKIAVANVKSKTKINIMDKFLIRGLVFLFFGVCYTLNGIFAQNKNNFDDGKINKVSKSLNVSTASVIYFLIITLALLVGIFLLGFLPMQLSYYLTPKNYDMFFKRMIIAITKILLIYLCLLLIRLMPPFKTYYSFNDAVNSYQNQNGQLNFLNYFYCSIFVCTFVLSLLGSVAGNWYFIFLNIFLSLIIFSVNYEIMLEIQKVKWLNSALKPIKFLSMKKASPLEEKCVNMVLKELEISNPKRDKMQTQNTDGMSYAEAYVQAKSILDKAGKFEKSDLDFIFAEVLNKSRAEAKLVKNISVSDYKKIEKIVLRRANGEPLTKIFGKTNFYGLDFIVTKDILSPRMDTERLVETVLNEIKPKQKILDIGTGSGAVAIAIAKNSKTNVTAVDISNEALEIAKANAKKNDVKIKFVKSDLFSGLGKFSKFDAIVSNPPYIPTKEIETLEQEVKNYDPILALDGGQDGLDFYKKIIEDAPRRLNKNGKIFFEVGKGQAPSVKKLLQKNFKDIKIVKDYNRIDRVVYATLV